MKKAPVKFLKRRVGRLKVMDLLVIVSTLILVAGGLWYRTQSSAEDASICAAPGLVHQLEISNETFIPSELKLSRCDQIRIDNTGQQKYEFAFGSHDDHIPYPGFSMQFLAPGEYFVLDATQAGDYVLHDHLRYKAKVSLSIREPVTTEREPNRPQTVR